MGSERDRAIAEAVRDACREVADEARDAIDGVDLDAIIAAVDAQHPAPPPRPTRPRPAARGPRATRSASRRAPSRAGSSRHLPTDEERETERAVVEAALAMRHTFPAGREWTPTEIALYNAAAHLLAIRAKRGAR